MQKLCIISDLPRKAAAIRDRLEGFVPSICLGLDRMRHAAPPRWLLIDIDLARAEQAVRLKEWLQHKRKDAKIVFAVDAASRLQVVQATAIGATAVIHRPVEPAALIKLFLDDRKPIWSEDADAAINASPGVAEAFHSLRKIFESACLGMPLDTASINAAGDAVVRRIAADGLGSWLDTVRTHHSRTYQHCLIVTGITVGFAKHIGLSRSDQLRLSLAAMLHDIGKARVPLAILEKPAALSGDEAAVMRKHPEYGLEALAGTSGLAPELLDIVVHHHEYLDGSGYPHGLHAREIADTVRILTICDVFGALVERRAYKPPLSPGAAYGILVDMGPKLDQDLVRAFGFARSVRVDEAA